MSDIREVARLAGVSIATVSRTFKKPELVKEKTRARVMSAANRLGYTPNIFGIRFRNSRSDTVLVLVPDISNPFFFEIIHGIEQVAHESGYSILLGDTQHDPERENAYANYLNTKQADGLLFLGHRLPASVSNLVGRSGLPKRPIVNACEYSPDLGVPGVHIDNEAAAYEAVSYLLELGHRRIGVVTGPMESPLSRNRLAGATKALGKPGITLAYDMVHYGDFSIEAGIAASRSLLNLSEPLTAIFCFNDEMAMGVMEYCRMNGVRIPEDLSLVGFDDIRFAKYCHPSLTTVYQPTKEIGRAAMQLLSDMLSNRQITQTERILPTKLVIRQSTASPKP
jgi:LacI family repressor for deo operon, udp, cdd, tsx, nupC, and nupG